MAVEGTRRHRMRYRAFILYRQRDAAAPAHWLREKLLRVRPPSDLLDRVTPQRRFDLGSASL